METLNSYLYSKPDCLVTKTPIVSVTSLFYILLLVWGHNSKYQQFSSTVQIIVSRNYGHAYIVKTIFYRGHLLTWKLLAPTAMPGTD